MFRNLLFFYLLLWSGWSFSSPKGTVVIVGDSLSAAYGMAPEQGWVYLLSKRLQDYRVINASISGETTAGGLHRLPQLFQKFSPTFVILELGANDGLRGLSLKEMKKNLAQMIAMSQQKNARVLLLGMRVPPNYGKPYAEKFRKVYYELAETYHVLLVPFFLEGVAEKRELIQEDNLHPTASAQQRLLDNVWEKLEELITSSPLEK